MKKFMQFVLLTLLTLTLFACQDNDDIPEDDALDYDAMFEMIADAIDEQLPIQFNRSIILPTFDEVNIEWTLNNEPITNILVYSPPFMDKEELVRAKITIADMTRTYTYPIFTLAPDSPLNRNIMFINTDIPIEDVTKDTYRNASVSVRSFINETMTTVFDNNQVEIRGRGNSTWAMPKRPYRLKFAEDVSILGMPEARNYVLLAEYADKSLLRNTVTFKFSSLLENIEHTPQTRVVEVYFNDAYHGVYTLTEHIEIHENKLSIDTIPNVEDAGFFLELDQRFYQHGNTIGVDGISVAGIPYVIKMPKPREDLTPQQVAYIEQYIRDMETALTQKSGYENYLDIDNFIDYFIVHELFKNVDVGWGSVFFYKRPSEVLKVGPIWDFDLAIGNANYIDYGPPNWYGMRDHKNRWFKLMMDIPEVREKFKVRYMEIYEEKIPLLLEVVDELGNAMIPAANRNFRRWDILGQYDWPNPTEVVNATTYSQQVRYIYNYIEARAEWMYYEVQSTNYQNGIFD